MLDLEHKMIHSYSFQSLHLQRVKAIAAILWPGYNCQLSGRYPLWQFVGPRRHLENSLDISPAYPQISLVAAQLFWKCHPIHLWKTSHHSLVPNWGSKMLASNRNRVSWNTLKSNHVCESTLEQPHPLLPCPYVHHRRCLPSISTFSMWSFSSIAFFVSGGSFLWVKSSPKNIWPDFV